MNNDNLVSIIIPVFEVENYLEQCLDSCLAQNHKNIEIIAVNDGSPDGCGDIIDRYAAKDSRVKHLRQENQGIPNARWNGILLSKGEYIMQVDGADFIPDNAVSCLLEEAIEHNCDMVFSDFYRVSENELRVKTLDLTNGLTMSGKDFFNESIRLEIVARLTKRDFFLHYELPKKEVGEDVFTMVQVLNECKSVRYIKCPLYYCRIRKEAMQSSPMTVKNEIEHWTTLIDFLVEKKYPKIVIFHIVLKTLSVFLNYSNDYDNPITAATKGDVDKLIKLALKNYPRLLKDNILDADYCKAIIITYLLRYLPKSVVAIHNYNKLRGKAKI